MFNSCYFEYGKNTIKIIQVLNKTTIIFIMFTNLN